MIEIAQQAIWTFLCICKFRVFLPRDVALLIARDMWKERRLYVQGKEEKTTNKKKAKKNNNK
jgi:hypothetical protein